MHRASAGILILSLAVVAQAGPNDWIRRQVLERIQVSGYRNLGFHLHSVTGDRSNFDALNYYGQGQRRFTDIGNIELVGDKVLGLLNFRATITDSRFTDPQQQQIKIEYAKGPWRTSLGDIWGSLLNTNQYASISRSMRGGTVEYRNGRLATKFLRSEAKGSARTVSIQGNNSAGPYYLQSNQIVADSEQVQLDGQDMVLGVDYVVNYEVGYITFITRLIPPTSTIVVSYEALGTNSALGLLQGAGASYSLGSYGTIGITGLEQKTRSGTGLTTRLEKFQGFGAPSTPYFLQFEPLRSRPITITVDGVLQFEGPDYRFDAINPSIFYFNRTMAASRNIDVVYTPKPTQTVDGNRRVIGIDYKLPISRYGQIGYSQATGKLLSEINPLSGTARGLTGSLRYKDYRLTAGVADIPETYVSVETRGFQRNERSSRLTLEHEGAANYGLNYYNSRIAVRTVDNTGAVSFSPARTTNAKGFLNLAAGANTNWTAEQSHQTSKSVSGESALDSTRLTGATRRGALTLSGGLERQSGFGRDTGNTRTDITLQSVFLNTDYRFKGGWTVGSRTTFSNIQANDEKGSGRDMTFLAAYRPNDRFSLDASYVDSDSGQVATLNQFQLGSGLGYDGNGFSGGAGNSLFNSGAIQQKVSQLRTQWKLSDQLSWDARYYQVKASGSVTSNSDTRAISTGLAFDLGNRTALNVSLDQSKTSFVGSSNRSEALSLDAYLDGSPLGPWSYRLGASALISGGNSAFKQDSIYLDGSVTYRIGSRQALILAGQTGSTKGYLPQNDSQLGLSYQYQLYQNIALSGSLRLRRLNSNDPSIANNSYSSRSFDLELIFNFGR